MEAIVASNMAGLEMSDVYSGRTPRKITALWQKRKLSDPAEKSVASPAAGIYPLLPTQQYIWNFQQRAVDSTMYNIYALFALKESVGRMQELLEARPTICVCDMHPKYNTVTVAQETGLPLVRLQHHYAHILSCMAENDCDEKVIGVSFDGTGYGTDGTIWGGEILVCDTHGFERAASIKPFKQVGGDASSKEGWRIAVQLIRDSWGEKAQKVCSELGICDEKTFKLQSVMADKGINTVTSTSAGRLFDAVSAILGIRRSSTFEGESSMSLEFAAERFEKQQAECEKTAARINGSGFETIDTTSLAGEIARRFIDGESAEKLAFVFHTSLADGIVRCCESISRKTGVKKCALSGGVFQNKLLLRLVKQQLRELGFEVLQAQDRIYMVPTQDNDLFLKNNIDFRSDIRATNDYKETTAVAYIANRYMKPTLKHFFEVENINVDEDTYALSELIQFIYRSAIRDGKPITVYIPSKRMRELFIDWINKKDE